MNKIRIAKYKIGQVVKHREMYPFIALRTTW